MLNDLIYFIVAVILAPIVTLIIGSILCTILILTYIIVVFWNDWRGR